MTPDTWQVSREKWHVTFDRWHVTDGGRWTLSQNCMSLVLPVWEWRYFEHILGKGWLSYLINQSMINKGVCRAAPATPGLLNTYREVPLSGIKETPVCWSGLRKMKNLNDRNRSKTLIFNPKCAELRNWTQNSKVIRTLKILNTGVTESLDVCRL